MKILLISAVLGYTLMAVSESSDDDLSGMMSLYYSQETPSRFEDDDNYLYRYHPAVRDLTVANPLLSNLDFLINFPFLHHLNISFLPNVTNFEPITHLDHLETLEMDAQPRSSCYEFLGNCRPLRNLRIHINERLENFGVHVPDEFDHIDTIYSLHFINRSARTPSS